MDRIKLMQNPLPVDRVAARVVKAARPENLWRPMPKPVATAVAPGEILRTAPLPKTAPAELYAVIGKRRGKLVICGYSESQGGGGSAKWVARCDCGNYEHRTRILRWVSTEAPDECRECQNRKYIIRGGSERGTQKARRAEFGNGANANEALRLLQLPANRA